MDPHDHRDDEPTLPQPRQEDTPEITAGPLGGAAEGGEELDSLVSSGVNPGPSVVGHERAPVEIPPSPLPTPDVEIPLDSPDAPGTLVQAVVRDSDADDSSEAVRDLLLRHDDPPPRIDKIVHQRETLLQPSTAPPIAAPPAVPAADDSSTYYLPLHPDADSDRPADPVNEIFPPYLREPRHVLGSGLPPRASDDEATAPEDRGQVAPRVMVLVTLAEDRAMFMEVAHEAGEQLAEKFRQVAQEEVEAAFKMRDSQWRAANWFAR